MIKSMKFKMKKISLKAIWAMWLVISLITTSLFTFIDVANHAPEQSVQLVQGAQHRWRVWRPFATQQTQFEMAYRRGVDGDLRLNVLGDKSKHIIGEPVIMQLSVNGTSCIMQQNNVDGWNDWVFRSLEPMQPACVLPEQAGWNDWQAQVIQVSDKLTNETTRLAMITPAGTLKHRADNRYGVMAEILFWGKLVWLPFFLFMSIPLMIDGMQRIAKRFDWHVKWQRSRQKFMWNLRNKW